MNKIILHLNLKAEYFNAIKAGEKPFEYRLKNEYWEKRLLDRNYDEVHFKLGYPDGDDLEKIVIVAYKGYEIQTIIHEHFGVEPVEVFAIHSSIEKGRDFREILDGSITIDFNSAEALKVYELCKDTNNHPNDAIIDVYGSFEDMYDSGDIRIDMRKVFR